MADIDRRASVFSLVLGLCVLGFSGCGGSSGDKWTEDRPPTFPVRGKVIYNGEPVPDAGVSFRSSDGTIGAAGRTNQNGEFELTTYESGDGAVAGSHQVTVVKTVVEGEDPSYFDENSPNYGKEPPPTKTVYVVPKKFTNFATSGLTATVEEGNNDVTLTLTD